MRGSFALFVDRMPRPLATAVLCALAAVAVGCSRSAPSSDAKHAASDNRHGDGDHHDHDHAHDEHAAAELTEEDIDMPVDFSSAVARLRKYQQQVFDAATRRDFEAVHRPLDESDLVIGKLMILARSSGVPKTAWEETNLARREIREQFDRVHAAIDAGEESDVTKIKPATEAALARLELVASQLDTRGERPHKEQDQAVESKAQP